MDKKFWEETLMELANPARVKVLQIGDVSFLMSKENTNDTMDWFKVNSVLLETLLKANGMVWMYSIEQCDGHAPFIYLYTGKDMKAIIKEAEENMEGAPDDRQFFSYQSPFDEIDIDKHDLSVGKEFMDYIKSKASDVFTIIEP